MRSLSRIIVLLVPFLLLVGCGSDDDDGGGTPQVNNNTAWFEVVPPGTGTVAPGDAITLRLMIHNAQAITGVEMPFKILGSECTVDNPVILPPFDAFLALPDVDTDPLEVDTIVTMQIGVSAGDHVFAMVTINIDAQAQDQTIHISEYNYNTPNPLGPGEVLHAASFAAGTTPYIVEFSSYEITVEVPPAGG
jgi:type 1 fimbria pilin